MIGEDTMLGRRTTTRTTTFLQWVCYRHHHQGFQPHTSLAHAPSSQAVSPSLLFFQSPFSFSTRYYNYSFHSSISSNTFCAPFILFMIPSSTGRRIHRSNQKRSPPLPTHILPSYSHSRRS